MLWSPSLEPQSCSLTIQSIAGGGKPGFVIGNVFIVIPLVTVFSHWYLMVSFLFLSSIACLAALNRFRDCFRLVSEELDQDSKNPDLYILRARLYEHFSQVGAPTLPMVC